MLLDGTKAEEVVVVVVLVVLVLVEAPLERTAVDDPAVVAAAVVVEGEVNKLFKLEMLEMLLTLLLLALLRERDGLFELEIFVGAVAVAVMSVVTGATGLASSGIVGL